MISRLALKEVSDDQDLSDPMILKNLDVKCVKSLNGCRVTDEILRQVSFCTLIGILNNFYWIQFLRCQM